MSKPKPSKPVLLAVSFKQFHFLKGIAEFTFMQILMLKGSLRFTLPHSVMLKRIALVVSLSLVFGLSYLVSWSPSIAHAATTSTVNFQARLESASGAIVPDGTYNVEFKIYNTLSTGGTAQGVCTGNCLWYEDYLVGGTPVTVSNGYMTVNLGSQTAFPSTIPWGSPLYLAINIGGTGGSPSWDGEMSPRLTLTAVPAAFSLESAAGSFTSTLTFVQPTASQTILIPNTVAGSTATVCLETDTHCGFESTTGTDFIQNQNASAQTTANFDISGEGQLATLDAEGSTLAIGGAATYTGAINIDTSTSVSSGTVTIGGTAQTGAITVGQATTSTQIVNIENATATSGTQTVNIDSGNDTASTQTVNIATGSSTTSGAKNVNIATGTPATGLTDTIDIGNGGTTTGTVSVTIGSNGNAAHTTTIQGGNGAGAISLQAASGGVISIGTNATNAVNIGTSGTPTYVSEGDNEASNLTSLSIVSHANGNLIALAFKLNLNDRVSTVTGGGVSQWHLVTYNDSGINGEEIWEGTVTSFGTNTVNATYIAASGSTELAYEEFSSTYGANTDWFVTTSGDKVNTPASTTITYPSLNATDNGGLYFGYGVTATAGTGVGSGTGFNFHLTTTGKNVLAYNTAITVAGNPYAPTAVTSSALSDAVGMIAIPYSNAGTVNVIGAAELNGNITSAVTIEPAQNMETAFQIQNGSGVSAFNVDTQDGLITSGDTLQVGPGVTTATPKYLYLADVTATSNGNPQIIGQWDSTNNWGIGPNDDISTAGGDSELRIGTTSANGVNTWTSTNQNLNLVVAGTENVQTLTNSTTALQVQNASAEPIFLVNTMTNNLISNPGFEVNTTGWAATGAGTPSIARNTVTSSAIYYGQASLAISLSTSANDGASTNVFTSSPGIGNYTFSFFAMGSSALTGLAVTITGGSATCTLNSTTVSASGFQEYYCSFTTTVSPITAIAITVATTSQTLYIDAVQLTATTSLNPYQLGGIQLRGVVTNPQVFESGSNSTTAFQIQNASGSDLMDIDTLDSIVNVGSTGTSNNISTVNIASTSGTGTQQVTIGGNGSSTSNQVVLQAGSDQIDVYNTGSNSIIIQGTAPNNGQMLLVQSTTTPSGASTVGTFFADSTGALGALAAVSDFGQAASTNTFTVTSNNSGTFTNEFTVGATGNVTATSLTNSTNAFQLVDAAGEQIFNEDDTNPTTDATNNQSNNEITNSSFETGTTGWAITGTGTTMGQSTNQAYIGNDSLQVNTGAIANAGVTYNLTTSTLVSNTAYTLTMYVRSFNNGGNWTTMALGYNSGSASTACLTAQTVTWTGWTKYTCTFTTGTTSGTPYIFVEQTDATQRTFYVDGVELQRWSILSNASMEQAFTASDWQAMNGSATVTQITTQHEDGTHSAQVTTSSTTVTGIKHNITLEPNTQYSLYMYMDSASTYTNNFEVGYNNGTGSTPCLSYQPITSGQWSYYICTLMTPSSNSGTPYFYIDDNSTPASGLTWYVDAVQLNVDNYLGGSYQDGQLELNGTIDSPITIQNAYDSDSEFQVQSAEGNTMMDIDSTDNIIQFLQNAQISYNTSSGTTQFYFANSLTSPTGSMRFRTNQYGTNVESGGSSLYLSVWPTAAMASDQDIFEEGLVGNGDLQVGNGSGTGDDPSGTPSPTLLLLDQSSTSNPTPTEINGGLIYNSTSNRFLCGDVGAWVDCLGGIAGVASAASAALHTCGTNTTACTAFSTSGTSIPAGYCQTGKIIHIYAAGTFGSNSTAPTLSFEFAFGASTTLTSDTAVGSASPAFTTAVSLANEPWSINFTVTCYSTTSWNTEGTLQFLNNTTSATTNVTLSFANTSTTEVTTAENLYLFPIFNTSNANNTITMDQWIVSVN